MKVVPDCRAAAAILLVPVTFVYGALFALPMAQLGLESLLAFEPGFVGARPDAPWTLENYRELATGAFPATLLATFRIGLLTSLAGVILAFPLAYFYVRVLPPLAAKALICFLVVLMLLGVLVRTYALQLLLGAAGPLRPLLDLLGVAPNGRGYIEFCVALGLLHYTIPLSALTLVPAVQAVSPRLHESALCLGASRLVAHLTVTLPLCVKGLLAAFTLSLTFCVSAFVIPMILGRGRVNFVSSLVFTRFSEIANYPSGAAIAVSMLAAALGVVAVLSLAGRRLDRAG